MSSLSRSFAHSALVLLASTSALSAAQPANTVPAVVVSATRVPTPASQVASSVTVITAEEIERKQRRTLPDILRDVPGLVIVQGGGPGSVAAIFMRGTNANHTKVRIDGIDVGDPSTPNGAFDFSQVLASSIERVEVLRGPQGGLYGSDAIGGVVEIFTKKGKGPAQFTVTAEAGTFKTLNQSASARGATDRFNYALDVAHVSAQNTKVTPDELVIPGRMRNDDSYDNKTISTKLGAKVTDNFDVAFVGRAVDSKLEYTSDDFTGPESLQNDGENREYFTRGTGHLSLFDGKFDQTLGVAYTDYRRRNYNRNNTPYDPEIFSGDRVKTDWQGDIKVMQGQVVTLGAEHQRDKVDGIPGADITNSAGSIQLQSSFGERVFNTVTLRRDHHERFGNRNTYRIAPAYLHKETGTKIKGSAGTGFKAPSLTQLYQDIPAFGFSANPNLRPETSKGYDVGFEQQLWDKRVEFGSTYFHNDIKNLINFNNSFTTIINIGEASTYGVENYVLYRPSDALSFRADYTYTRADNEVTKQELTRRPKHKASLNGTWLATDRLSLSSTVLYTGSWVDVNRAGTAQGLRPGSYTVLNLAAGYDIGDGLTAFARVDNALDKDYQNPVGFERPGIGLYGGLSYSFGAEKF